MVWIIPLLCCLVRLLSSHLIKRTSIPFASSICVPIQIPYIEKKIDVQNIHMCKSNFKIRFIVLAGLFEIELVNHSRIKGSRWESSLLDGDLRDTHRLPVSSSLPCLTTRHALILCFLDIPRESECDSLSRISCGCFLCTSTLALGI